MKRFGIRRFDMIKNYITIAWRNLNRNRAFSAINLLGLSIGITCTLFILLWVQHETSYDKDQPFFDSIYQVKANRTFDGQTGTNEAMPFPVAKALETNFPQVIDAAVISYPEQHVLTIGNKKLKRTGHAVSPHFFRIFSWKFLQGNAASSITDQDALVLTRSTAIALFGTENVLNKTLRMDNQENRRITAIIEDLPGNSFFAFDFITPYNVSDPSLSKAQSDWVSSFCQVFVHVRPDADMQKLTRDLNKMAVQQRNGNDPGKTEFLFHAMSKWHLWSDFTNGKNTGGMIEYVRLFTAIALIILLIACVNFMNLSTARSEKRAREVGIRKTLGSVRKQLMTQFYYESIMLSIFAYMLSFVSVLVLLPAFNTLVGKNLRFDPLEPGFIAGSLLIVLITGFLAGSYPALYLSSFNPVRVLKGTFNPGKKAIAPRRILVVFQFVISVLLIASTLIIYQQIRHVKNRDLGYTPDNLLIIPASADIVSKYTVIKNELLRSGQIQAITSSSAPITEIWNFTPAPDWDGKPAGSNIICTAMSTGADFSKTVGVKITEGRDFTNAPADSSAMILNQAAVRAMGLKSPVGMQMRYFNKAYTIVGVASDLVMASPYKPVDPMLIFCRPERMNVMMLRLAGGIKPQDVLPNIGRIFKQYNPAYPFEYSFADQEFGKKFVTEELIGRLTNIFAGLAIFICCLGLAGLASFTIEKRFREIGIRKVLGASVQQILMLVSREFLVLVFIGFIIAIPLTWWAMHSWLEHYTYRITISIWYFLGTGTAVLMITLLVVSLNTIKAAMMKPVKSLRSE